MSVSTAEVLLDALGVDSRDRIWVDRSRLGRPGSLHLGADKPPTVLHLPDPKDDSQTVCGERAGGGVTTELRHRAPTSGNVTVCTRCEEIARPDEEEAAPDGGRAFQRGFQTAMRQGAGGPGAGVAALGGHVTVSDGGSVTLSRTAAAVAGVTVLVALGAAAVMA